MFIFVIPAKTILFLKKLYSNNIPIVKCLVWKTSMVCYTLTQEEETACQQICPWLQGATVIRGVDFVLALWPRPFPASCCRIQSLIRLEENIKLICLYQMNRNWKQESNSNTWFQYLGNMYKKSSSLGKISESQRPHIWNGLILFPSINHITYYCLQNYRSTGLWVGI